MAQDMMESANPNGTGQQETNKQDQYMALFLRGVCQTKSDSLTSAPRPKELLFQASEHFDRS